VLRHHRGVAAPELDALGVERRLDALQPQQDPAVRTEQREDAREAGRHYDGEGGAEREGEALRAGKRREPRRDAEVRGPRCREGSKRERREDAVAHQRLPAGRSRVELSEAVALGRAAAREAHAHGYAEDEQERKRADPPGEAAAGEEQQRRHAELRGGEETRERRGQAFGGAELDDGLPRARPVGELRGARDREDGRQGEARQTVSDEGLRHSNTPSFSVQTSPAAQQVSPPQHVSPVEQHATPPQQVSPLQHFTPTPHFFLLALRFLHPHFPCRHFRVGAQQLATPLESRQHWYPSWQQRSKQQLSPASQQKGSSTPSIPLH
jgi:hypothetical protein